MVLIPAYNAEHSIAKTVLQCERYGQVLVCNDGSRDMTGPIARRLARTIEHPVNQGKGSALRDLFLAAIYAEADSVVTIDVDGQHDPNDIPNLTKWLDRADVVIGARPTVPSVRLIGNKILSGGLGYDSQSGFRAYRGSILSDILPKERGFGVDMELLQNALDHDLKIAQVPIMQGEARQPHSMNLILQFADIAVSQIRRRLR